MTADDLPTSRGSMRIRPYALTGGRTRSAMELSLETLVLAKPARVAASGVLTAEDSRIISLAAEPISVAEIASHMGIVMGVARVLVGDLVSTGVLDRSAQHKATMPEHKDVNLLERVLDGLKAL